MILINNSDLYLNVEICLYACIADTFVVTIVASAELFPFLSTAFIKYEPTLAGTIALSHFLLGHLTRFVELIQFAPVVTF